MTVVSLVARMLLGLVFLGAGLAAFFIVPPPLPGLAGTFNVVFAQSHWSLFVAVAQIVIGTLLLTNRYVPVALIMLVAFLYNSFAFHLTMQPLGLPGPAIALLLAAIVARPYKAVFETLLLARGEPIREKAAGRAEERRPKQRAAH